MQASMNTHAPALPARAASVASASMRSAPVPMAAPMRTARVGRSAGVSVVAQAGRVPKGVNVASVSTMPLTAEAEAPPRRKLRMMIDGQWYDTTGWAKAHPGGSIFVRLMDGRDATDVFYALHSYGPNGDATAKERLAKLPKCDPPAAADAEVRDSAAANLPTGHAGASSTAFQALRVKLENEGWFKRNVLKEAWALTQVLGLCAIGTELAWADHPLLAILSIGLGMQQAGWLGHDYIHGRGPWCTFMRQMPALINGHSTSWWAEKHSLHHSWTNHEGLDRDVGMEPVFFLRPPSESGRKDSPLRGLQHLIGVPVLAVVFWLWRYNSYRFLIRGVCADGLPIKRDPIEMACLALNFLWLATLGWPVALGSISLAGWLVGNLVTATHQTEDIFPREEGEGGMGMPKFDEYVVNQFNTTRDAECEFGPLETWLWGGMDVQLEHHLFPSMPRYRYHELRPLLKEWAAENNIEYKSSPSRKILQKNWDLLKEVAQVPMAP